MSDQATPTILTRILARKDQEVAERQQAVSEADLRVLAEKQSAPRELIDALDQRMAAGDAAVIAEVKKASPSKGVMREAFHPADIAKSYAQGGAACLSVLTDADFFQGHEDYLIAAREACDLPVLRKDFMVDPWQVAEARALGADAILIIVAALDDSVMAEIEAAALDHSMDVLIEVHDAAEMDRAARLSSRLIGVNNRDLKTFTTDLATTEQLAPRAPAESLLVGESGISSHADCARLAGSGVRSFLVGESLMRQADVAAATRTLLHG